MGIFSWLFGKREGASEDGGATNLAFVLLTEPMLPDGEAIVSAFRDFAAPGEELREEVDEDPDAEASDEIRLLTFSTGEQSFVALMPAAVPEGEADQAAQYSLSRFKDDWTLPPHHAHLLVTFHPAPDVSPIVSLSRFTSLLAAVAKVSPAVGVYWGNAGATHDSDFFVSMASDQGLAAKMMLWSGLSIAREGDGRLSLLSLGMEQLNLPDLLLVAGASSEGVALETMYDLLLYVVERGELLPEGDTVGRTQDQHLPIHYVKSPLDPKKKVWRVELP